MKKALFAVAVVALLAVSAQAGEIKVHCWPCTPVAQELATVQVTMDVGYWVKIHNQGDKIKLTQSSIHKYSGSRAYKVSTNSDITLSVSISPKGNVPGDYSVGIDPANVAAGASEFPVTITVNLNNANLKNVVGGSKDVYVADVKIKVLPSASSFCVNQTGSGIMYQ